MTESHLIDILEDLTDEEFKKFKWNLKLEKLGDVQPIKASQLAKADREETVDLMCQKYEDSEAAQVAKSVLMKISRNDLVTKLIRKLGPADAWTAAAGETQCVADERKMLSIRSKFIDKVSEPVLRKLLDKLLEQQVIGDQEMEAFSEKQNRATRAGDVIDAVRRKGPVACSLLVTALCAEDTYLSRELGLM